MAIFELKTEVPREAAPVLADLLAEREEQRLMVLEDKPSGRAWLTGYFESQAEAAIAWRNLAEVSDAGWAKTEPVVRELNMPVLAVEASDNSLDLWWKGKFTLEQYHERIQNVPNVEIALIQDAGHMMHHDQPDILAGLIERFIA